MSATPLVRPSTGRRPLDNLVGLKRSATQSFYKAAGENPVADLERPPIQDFDSSDIWPWITKWIEAAFQTDFELKKHAFEAYANTGDRGHYDLSGLLAPDNSIRIGLAGD
jgi:hypothetical protein